ncbi:MAG: deoxyribonuclease IV [Simkaniaceae bacterium]|nr:deoxyribonuclease IV [Simkaniaceae bacterium]
MSRPPHTVPKTAPIGAHMSVAGGVHKALLRGEEIDATTVQIFTANQKQWAGKPITDEESARWHDTLIRSGISHVMSHASYLVNLGSPKPDILQKSLRAFKEEIRRCLQLRLSFLNFHPGAATGDEEERCLLRISESIKKMSSLLATGSGLTLLLETTAGQGTVMGHRFEQLAYIIDRVRDHLSIGVCIDTCHIFAAGYDIRTERGWDETLREFDRIIGLRYLCALHVNDSKYPLGSRKDRHASLGHGEIGYGAFQRMMRHDTLKAIPKYLETPDGDTMWKREIALLRRYAL